MAPELEPAHPRRAGFVEGLAASAARAGGEVVAPSSPRFDDARRIYNRLHDPYPLALVRTLDPSVLLDAAHACQAVGLPMAVRGGGHHIGGGSGGDGGVVLDFSTFRDVRYCAQSQTCSVQPGARLADIDRELARHGRVIPTGTVSDTGVTGLTLGGGIGWLVGSLGLACDHLVGADVLLANGQVVRAEDDPGGLLWALRGGGGAGVVLALRFRTAPLPVTTTGSVLVLQDVEASLAVLLEHLSTRCPRELTVAPVLARTEDGHTTLRVEYCSVGQGAPGLEGLLQALPAGMACPFDGSFAQWQAHLDPEFLPPQRGYWKACYLEEVGSSEASTLVAAVGGAPSRRCSVLIEHLHGAFADKDGATSAFPLRRARFGVLFAARWPSPEGDEQHIAWARGGYSRLDPVGRLPAYANYAPVQDPRAAATFPAESRERLRDLRNRFDFPALSRRPGSGAPAPQKGARR